MQLPIDTVIQPKFTQHQLQRALYSLWQARCRDGQIPLWQSLPCEAFGPYLSAACVIGLAASNRSVIRIASTQVNQLLGRTVVAKRWTVFAPQQSSHNLNTWYRRFLPGNPR